MQRKKWLLVAAATAILTCAAAFCACESGDGTANANGNTNGNSSPCDLPDTPQNYLPCGTEISAEEFVVNREENTLYLKIPNEQTTFSFLNKINVSENSQWKLYTDIECTQEIVSKTTSVKVGDNVFYILVTQGNHLSLYTATVRRRPVYTVSFKVEYTNFSDYLESQKVEEDGIVEQPSVPVLRGYTFTSWDYDFSKPITESTVVSTKLSVLPEMLNYNFTSTTTTCIITSVKDTTVTSAIIPDYVTGIGDSAFAYCSGLTKISIPDGVTDIGDSAFVYCNRLTEISFPDSVLSMGTNVFKDCSRLQYNEYDNAYYLGNEQNPAVVLFQAKNTEITDCTINEQTKFIYDNAFSGCKNLSGITLPEGLINIGAQSFYNCTGITNIIIPDGVTKIGAGAFSGCLIEEATIPSLAIGYIPKNYLTSVIITSGNYIGDRAFKDCNGLTTVTILNSVKSINIEAFYNCRNLTSVTIPNSVIRIQDYAFYNCSNLTRITFTGTMAQWQAIPKYTYEWNGQSWNNGTGNYTVYCTDGNITK